MFVIRFGDGWYQGDGGPVGFDRARVYLELRDAKEDALIIGGRAEVASVDCFEEFEP